MRIRALKPGFFKNEHLCELSFAHRIAYQGLWCCADRAGRLEDRPKRLKAEIFPYDDLDLNAVLWDLVHAGLIIRYEIDHQPLIWIPSWDRHQHPRQDEATSILPEYVEGSSRVNSQVQTTSTISHSTVTDPSLSSDGFATRQRMGQLDSGTSGDGTSGSGVPATQVSAEPTREPCRAIDLMELWNATTKPPIPRCRELTDNRRRKIRGRMAKRPNLGDWRAIFERIQASSFCRGEAGSRHGQNPWVADFDWIVANDTNPAKVLEGKYDDRDVTVRPHLSARNTQLLAAVANLED